MIRNIHAVRQTADCTFTTGYDTQRTQRSRVRAGFKRVLWVAALVGMTMAGITIRQATRPEAPRKAALPTAGCAQAVPIPHIDLNNPGFGKPVYSFTGGRA